MKTKRFLGFGLPVMLLVMGLVAAASLTLAGCGDDNDGDIWLADLSNPFIGTWKSDQASDGTRLTLIGKTDGTFKYEMEGVPEEMGLPNEGNGSYIIREDVLVAYFDFGLVKGSVFEVIDNDTLAVKEFMLNAMTGEMYLSREAVPFRRIGTVSNTANQPTVLPDNIFINSKKWSANIPEPEDPTGETFYPTEWLFRNDGTVTCTFIGLGPALGFPDQEDAPFNFSYVVSANNTLVLFAESWGAYEIMMFQFTKKVANTINIKQYALANNFVAFESKYVIAEMDFALKQ
jgi:hypothetical protein